MKMRMKQWSFNGEHWWDVQDPNWIVEVDDMTDENPMKAVETKKLPTKKIFGDE